MDILGSAIIGFHALPPVQGGSPARYERSRHASAAAHILVPRYR